MQAEVRLEATSRSRLYNLTPIGLNTGYTESLISYLARLAEAHGVLVGILIAQEIAPRLNKKYINNDIKKGGCSFYNNAHTINGMDSTAKCFAENLSDLTQVNELSSLTFLKWHKTFSTRHLLRSNKAWCPKCFDEWLISNRPIYEPLIWSLQDLQICSKHGISLQEQCPFCLSKLPFLSRNLRLGYCSNCFNWLGDTLVEEVDKPPTEWQVFASANLEKLISLNGDKNTNCEYQFSWIINDLINKLAAGNAAKLAFNFGCSKTTLINWSKGRQKPTINIILKICYQLGMFIDQMLISADIPIRINNLLNSIPRKVEIQKNLQYSKINGETIKKALKDISESKSIEPISLTEVARRLSVHKRTLYRIDSELCYIISQKFQNEKKNRRLKRLDKDINLVRNAVMSLHNEGIYPSRRKVEEICQRPSLLREAPIQKAWKSFLRELDKVQEWSE